MAILFGTAAAALYVDEGRLWIPLLSMVAVLLLFLMIVFRRTAPNVRGYLVDDKGKRNALHGENLVGSGSKCDIRLRSVAEPKYGFIKLNSDGTMLLIPLMGTFAVNGRVKEGAFFPKKGDKIRAGKDVFVYEPAKVLRNAWASGWVTGSACVVDVELILILIGSKVLPAVTDELRPACIGAFALLLLAGPMYFVVRLIIGAHVQPSVVAALLVSSLSMAVTAAYTPGSMLLQAICVCIGIALHLVFEKTLGYEKVLPTVRYAAVAFAMVLLIFNVINATSLLGARNWLSIGGVNFQPSELVKVAVVMFGAVTMKASVRRSDKLLFMGFSALCVISMALISDFGTAAVFFFAYLVMMWVRSGVTDVVLSVAAAAAGCGLVAIVRKDAVAYAVSRVLNWGSAWENVLSSGYQQTRAMMAAASGGMFGVGFGRGWLGDIFAAGSDMPFAVVWEELGFVSAAAAVLAIALVGFDAVKSAASCSNIFLAVGSCGAAAVFTAQLILNVCGTMDMLPFTGVTFPFLSTGGTSMLSCWLLLAFITSANNLSRGYAETKEGRDE